MNSKPHETNEVLQSVKAPTTTVLDYLDDPALLDQIEELLVVRALTRQQFTAANMLDFFARNTPAVDPVDQAA